MSRKEKSAKQHNPWYRTALGKLMLAKWHWFLLVGIVSLATSALTASIPLSSKYFIDKVDKDLDFQRYTFFVSIIFGGILLRAFMEGFGTYVVQRIQLSIGVDVRNMVHHRLSTMPYLKLISYRSGKISEHLLKDATSIVNGVGATLSVFMRFPIEVISVFSVLLYIHPQLAIMILVLIALAGLITQKGSRIVSLASLHVVHTMSDLAGFIQENFQQNKLIRQLGVLGLRQKEFQTKQNDLMFTQIKHKKYEWLFNMFRDAIIGSAIAMLLLYIGYEFSAGHLTQGDVVATSTALLALFSTMRKTSKSIAQLRSSLRAGKYVQQIFSEPSKKATQPNNKRAKEPYFSRIEHIEFRDISFEYDGRPALESVNLSLQPGKPYILQGVNGAGKSTLIDILIGLLPAEKGQIRCNNNAMRQEDLYSMLPLFGFVPQAPVLFNGTYRYNIVLDRENITEQRIKETLYRVGLDTVLGRKGHTIDNEVGDEGSGLSLGERQRFCIARSLVHNPDVLILDEPVNNLDQKTEKIIWRLIEEYSKENIVLTVTHDTLPQNFEYILLKLNQGYLNTSVRGDNGRLAEFDNAKVNTPLGLYRGRKPFNSLILSNAASARLNQLSCTSWK